MCQSPGQDFFKTAVNPSEWFGFGFFIWMRIPVILCGNNTFFTHLVVPSTTVLEVDGSEEGPMCEICLEDLPQEGLLGDL